jgi:hypothetical protein
MDVEANEGANLGMKFEVDGVVGLLVPSIKLCRCFKRLHMACPFVDFKHTNTPSFNKTTLFNPSSFDVLVFNTRNGSPNFSSKVSS